MTPLQDYLHDAVARIFGWLLQKVQCTCCMASAAACITDSATAVAVAADAMYQHQSQLDNESHCHACGSDREPELLLCCEACPFVYHTYCLTPPLSEVPAGAWYCPVCTQAEELLDDVGPGLDRILAVRKAAPKQSTAAAGAAAPDQQQQQQGEAEGPNEFFIKWKEHSFIHCSWISNEVMQRAANIKHIGAANPVATRLRKFWRAQAEAAANGDVREAEERGQLVNGINPAWTQVMPRASLAAFLACQRGCCDQQVSCRLLICWTVVPHKGSLLLLLVKRVSGKGQLSRKHIL
jgi:hypothetical protein